MVLELRAGEVGELEAGKRKVYEGAVQLVQRRLATIAEQRGVAASALDPLFAEVCMRGWWWRAAVVGGGDDGGMCCLGGGLSAGGWGRLG